MRALVTVLLACALAGAVAPAATADAGAAERIVLQRAPGLDAGARAELRDAAGVTLERGLSLPRVEVVQAAPGDRAEALATLRSDPDVVWAEPLLRRTIRTADTHYAALWALPRIQAESAWSLTRGAGVTVAVVDSGADLEHPDLAGRLVAGHDYVDGDAVPADGNGHGTHVAGTIAANENTIGVVGVAPQASVMPLRVLDDEGSGFTLDVALAFDRAGDEGIRVVSASLGAPQASAVERAAIRSHPNTLYVVAAGNDGLDNDGPGAEYPCAYDEPNVLCVGASTEADGLAAFSNFGATTVDLFAPGVNIVSTVPGSYGTASGTSMATPHVSAAAALILARHPGWPAAEVKRALLDSATDLPAFAGRSVSGGRLDVAAALAAAPPAVDELPAAPGAVTATAGDGQVLLDWADSPEPDVVGYRVYRAAGSGSFVLAGTVTGSAHVATGLANGVPYRFRVAAVDAGGQAGPLSLVAAATPVAPPSPPAPVAPVTPAPPLAAAPSVAPRAALSELQLSGRAQACRGCRSRARLRFRLGASARVGVRLELRACGRGGCSWVPRGRMSVRLPAGVHRWTVGARLAGLTLRPGSWRVTLSTPDDRARLRFAAHGR